MGSEMCIRDRAYLVSSVLFILSLRGLSHPSTARRGNFLGILGMTIAIVTTLSNPGVLSYKEIGIALFKYKDDLQRVSNQYNFTLPSLMRHVITIALYFYIMLGTVAGQGNIFHLDNKMSMILKLGSNFPLYYTIKHLLIIGWLQTATDLQNPYGEDE